MNQNPVRIKLGLMALLPALTTGCLGQVSKQGDLQPSTGKTQINMGEPREKVPGVIVHIDPKTGEIITLPKGAPGEVRQPSLDTTKKPPPPELRQIPVPGGGFMIELDERFETPLTATIDPDGNVKLEHKRVTSDSEAQNK